MDNDIKSLFDSYDSDSDDEERGSSYVKQTDYSRNEELCLKKENMIISALRELRNDAPDTNAYDRDYNKLVDMLCEYALYYDRFKRKLYKGIDNYSVEIFTVTMDCLNYYTGEPEKFIRYFTVSLNRALAKADGKEYYDDIHGGVVGAIKTKDFKELYKFKPGYTGDPSDDPEEICDSDEYDHKTDEYGSDNEDVQDGQRDALNTFLSDNNYNISDFNEFAYGLIRWSRNSEGDYLDPLENVAVNDDINTGSICNDDNPCKELLDHFSKVYCSLLEKQKKRFAMIITAHLISMIDKELDLLEILKEQDFFDQDAFDYYISSGEAPQQKWIAEFLGVKEASISRDFTKFKELILSELINNGLMMPK